MYMMRLSTLWMYTCAALNGLGEVTVPDKLPMAESEVACAAVSVADVRPPTPIVREPTARPPSATITSRTIRCIFHVSISPPTLVMTDVGVILCGNQILDRLRKTVRHVLPGRRAAARRDDDVLLVVEHIRHRPTGLRRGHVDGADLGARGLVVRAQHRAPLARRRR